MAYCVQTLLLLLCMLMRFHVDGGVVGKATAVMPLRKKTDGEEIIPMASCGGSFTGSSGYIESPNYPNKYPNNADCTYEITVSADETIEFSCSYFRLSDRFFCHYLPDYADQMTVGLSGSLSYNTETACYTGASWVSNGVESTGNKMIVHFYSNWRGSSNGFRCRYTAVGGSGGSDTTTPAPPTTPRPTVPAPEGCGITRPSSRIVGGEDVDPYEYPWLCRIWIHVPGGYYQCGSAVIDANWILTAAHCVEGSDVSSVTVRCGLHEDINGDEKQRRTVSKQGIIMHSDYNSNNLVNDIALLELDQSLSFDDAMKTAPVCLPTASMRSRDFLDADGLIAVGWGKYHDNSGQASFPKDVTLDPDETCYSYYIGMSRATHFASVLCAGATAGKGICSGDSGGPLHYKDTDDVHYQVGVHSFDASSCEDASPSGFARVTNFMPWIIEKTGIQFP